MISPEANSIKPKHKGTKVLFSNPVVEKLSRTHIAVPISMFAVFSIFLLVYGYLNTALSLGAMAALFMTGLLVFTFVEYMVHRHVFHMHPDSELKEKMQYNFHGVHHEYPKDKDRLAMPPLVSATISAVLFLVFRLLMGDYVFAFLPGFVTGYSAYLFVHYAVHAYTPPKNFLKILWVNHSIHHYKNHDKAYGVSSPLWDYIFRTMP